MSGLTGSGLVLQNNDGEELAIASDGAFVFRTAITAGSGTYNVEVRRRPANPMQSCVVVNGTGTAATSNITNIEINFRNDYARFIYQYEPLVEALGIYVANEHTAQLQRMSTVPMPNPQIMLAEPNGRFVYMIPNGSDYIYSYSIDPQTGGLTEIGQPLQAGAATTWGYVHPNGKFLYIVNVGSDQIARFGISDDGVLTSLSPVSLPVGSFPARGQMTRDGRYLLVSNGGTPANSTVSNVAVFSVNASTGMLTSVPGSPFNTSMQSWGLLVTGDDRFLYVLSESSTRAAAFRMDQSSGSLTPITAPPRTTSTSATVAHPGLPYIYVLPRAANAVAATQIEALAVDLTTGQLSSMGVLDMSESLLGLEVDRTGKYLYAYGVQSLTAFTIDVMTGRLTDQRVISGRRSYGATVKTHTRPSLGSKFVFAPHEGPSNVSMFAVDRATGGLNSVSAPLPMRGRAQDLSADSGAKFLYAAEPGANAVFSYVINDDGRVLPMLGGEVRNTDSPFELAMHPTNKFLFATSYPNSAVHSFSVDANGRLTRLPSVGAPYETSELAIHPESNKLYVVNGDLVSVYGINSTGQLTRELDRDVNGATGIAFHPNGRKLFVVDFDSSGIKIWRSDLTSPPLTIPTAETPYKIAIDPSGRFAYVLNAKPTISAYLYDHRSESLSIMPGGPYAIEGLPSALDFDKSGNMLYVSTTSPDSVIAFRVDSASGALVRVGTPIPTGALTYSVLAAGTRQ